MEKSKHQDQYKSQKPIQTLTIGEERLIITYLEDPTGSKFIQQNTARNRLAILLMLDAGLRVGELSSLLVQHLFFCGFPVGAIDLAARATKNNTPRTIPVSVRLSDSIWIMNEINWIPKAFDPRDCAFAAKPNPKPITVRQFQRIVHDVSLSSIGHSIHPHILRHTFATKLMRVCSIRVVQQLLGHRSLSSTEVYTHPNHDDLQKAINKINEGI